MDEELGNLIGGVGGFVHAQAGIIHTILVRQGLTTFDEIADIAEGQMESTSSDFVRGQLQAMVDQYRSGGGPLLTVIDGGKSGS